MNLRIPGPTPCPEATLQAMTRQMINHRGQDFATFLHDLTARLKTLFQTKNDVFVLTASGTGGMEAAIVNTLSPGDRVLAVSNGYFGERFADIAEVYGAQVERLRFEWGQAADPETVRQRLKAGPAFNAVLVTHNETSTGVTNDLAAIAAAVREFDSLLLVDAVSSLGCTELATDAWGCDIVVTGSQKGLMTPPGLALVSVSPRAWQAHAQARTPRYYWDFGKCKSFLEKGQTPWTPGLSTYYALAASVELMVREGLPSILARHQRLASFTRQGVRGLGLDIFGEEAHASAAVTAVTAPPGLDVKKLLNIMRQEHDTVLAGGQQRLEGKIFRIGHLGWVQQGEIEATLAALKVALPQAGFVPVA
ncbi:MAG: alanine--glyoxylate aminotransferase family protein [Chloroflexi bacterium]|nr:alanine--glyoxylate aminotransferase family protein [Chloroflexota bacterium]